MNNEELNKIMIKAEKDLDTLKDRLHELYEENNNLKKELELMVLDDEVKEILDNFEKYEARYKLHNETQFIIMHREIKTLLDYITNLQRDNEMYAQLKDEYEEEIKNLQQENEILKEDYSKAMELIDKGVENSYKLLKDYKQENERLKENLQQEKKDFKEANDYCFELKDYKSRCEKAVEYNKEIVDNYLEEDDCEYCDGRYATAKHNLNILQNGSDSQ